ncbi:MAG TPA: YicC/YloC family endoribonuclease [Clostridia bacterium]|nr:YicC/YloC family endoribonuclease [Clostridia bacterium]
MIKSMTGYGRAQEKVDGYSIVCEIKSVNHRFFEFYSRTGRTYGFLDEKLKSYMQGIISRGKVECFVQIEALEESDIIIEINHSIASGYINSLNELSEKYGIDNDVSVSTLSKYPDIFSIRKEQADEERIWKAVKEVAGQAVERFLNMRENEGRRLRDDVLSRANVILENVEFVEERSPQSVKEYNDKLILKMKEFLDNAQVDEQRILTEAALFADKVAVAEETVRLRSHIDQLRDFLNVDGAIGRKMDFLVQEINRETNTIGSKALDVEIARRVLEIKSEVEKIREQIQNIE